MQTIHAARIEPLDIQGDCGQLFEAAAMLPFKECVGGGDPVRKTLFSVHHDKANLYFAFRVYDDNIRPIRTMYNSKIYDEEVVEIFIAGANIKKYVEFEVSPNNTQFCGLLRNTLKGRRRLRLLKTCLFRSKVTQRDYGYDAVIVAPIKAICGKLNINDLNTCFFNATRMDRPSEKTLERSALSPTRRPGFHFPERFVRLVLSDL